MSSAVRPMFLAITIKRVLRGFEQMPKTLKVAIAAHKYTIPIAIGVQLYKPKSFAYREIPSNLYRSRFAMELLHREVVVVVHQEAHKNGLIASVADRASLFAGRVTESMLDAVFARNLLRDRVLIVTERELLRCTPLQ